MKKSNSASGYRLNDISYEEEGVYLLVKIPACVVFTTSPSICGLWIPLESSTVWNNALVYITISDPRGLYGTIKYFFGSVPKKT
jgi:hypothetical protein